MLLSIAEVQKYILIACEDASVFSLVYLIGVSIVTAFTFPDKGIFSLGSLIVVCSCCARYYPLGRVLTNLTCLLGDYVIFPTHIVWFARSHK